MYIGFLNEDNAPTPKPVQCLPEDLHCLPQEQLSKSVIFHNKSVFCCNEDQRTQWGSKDMHAIRPKGKVSGMMVSDFIVEQGGYIDQELILAQAKYSNT